MWTLISATAMLLFSTAVFAQRLHDTFDTGVLDAKNWWIGQIEPGQISFLKPGRCGAAAVSITTVDADSGKDCSPDEQCQRAEVRTSDAFWPPYGPEVWFSFSFRIEGDMPLTGSHRTVIGQWKAPNDDSPFVAQRFDNGVFHITVQDGDTRRVVASAEGDPDQIVAAQSLLAQADHRDPRVINGIQALRSLYELQRALPDPARQILQPRVQGLLSGQDVTGPAGDELSRSLSLPNGVVPLFGALSYVAEPEKYLGAAQVEIIPEKSRHLPDPRKGWVDLQYRIKGGRTDNEFGPRTPGELEIWADGQKIVTVKGNLGYQLRLSKPVALVGPYFKFGLYRKKLQGKLVYHFDEFSQVMAQAEIRSLCATPN